MNFALKCAPLINPKEAKYSKKGLKSNIHLQNSSQILISSSWHIKFPTKNWKKKTLSKRQGRSVGVWRPGQEVKLAPLVLIFPEEVLSSFSSMYKAPICTICTKWLVYHFFFISWRFQRPLKWRPGHVPPFDPPSYATGIFPTIWLIVGASVQLL